MSGMCAVMHFCKGSKGTLLSEWKGLKICEVQWDVGVHVYESQNVSRQLRQVAKWPICLNCKYVDVWKQGAKLGGRTED